MGLEELAQLGWYKAEPSSPEEIADLLSIVERSLADIEVIGISDDLRFQAAYGGILTLATVALRASGYRVSQSQSHHQRAIESLEFTLTTEGSESKEKWVRKLKAHSKKRNTTSYDLAGGVSCERFNTGDEGLEETLKSLVDASLKAAHPELLAED